MAGSFVGISGSCALTRLLDWPRELRAAGQHGIECASSLASLFEMQIACFVQPQRP
jgi:hypothetical protein